MMDMPRRHLWHVAARVCGQVRLDNACRRRLLLRPIVLGMTENPRKLLS